MPVWVGGGGRGIGDFGGVGAAKHLPGAAGAVIVMPVWVGCRGIGESGVVGAFELGTPV